MEYLVSSTEMKKYDSFTISNIGMPSMVLMERAAMSVVEELYDDTFDLRKVLVVCGSGNNGGDGLAIARLLYLKNVYVDILFIGNEEKCTIETLKQLDVARNYGLKILCNADFKNYTTIVDAIVGIGIVRPIQQRYADIIAGMNNSGAKIASVDVPSGISADTGKIMGIAVKANKTITFAFKKIGLVLYPGADYAGVVKVKDIGINDISFDGIYPKILSYEYEELKRIPKRIAYSNKGTFGRVLVVAGSVNMCGAAYFSAEAAYRMGTGLVKIYTASENRQILQTMLPEAILVTYDGCNIEIQELIEAIEWANVIIVGPGIGTSLNSKLILSTLLSTSNVPLIIDADGINIISEQSDLLENNTKSIVITPHLGEMSRLIKKDICEIAENIIIEAEKYAKNKNVICVLKDVKTVIADPEGATYINQSGNNGMATGGSGDVLTGIIGGLVAQKMDVLEAAVLGTYIHGLAGDSAASKKGTYGIIARDIIDCINNIVK